MSEMTTTPSSTVPLMTHEYSIGREDFHAFYGIWLKRSLKDKRRFIALICLAIAYAAWPTLSHLNIFSHANLGLIAPSNYTALLGLAAWNVFLSALGIAIPLYALAPLYYYVWLGGAFYANPALKRINTTSLSAGGLTKIFEGHAHTTPWAAVREIVETPTTLLVFMGRNNAMMIPKSAFNSPSEAEGFLAAARHYLDQAQTQAG